jgi:hypothetical protein
MTKQTETGLKKGRGRAQRSTDLINSMYTAAKKAQPITGRGVGYKLFIVSLFSWLAPYVIVFMMGLLMGTIVSNQCFQSECKRFFAYHPDAPFCELVAKP